jgi:protein tyrosine phosphatase (PTP) superfamily phosphohydrolase (DUF442 family)
MSRKRSYDNLAISLICALLVVVVAVGFLVVGRVGPSAEDVNPPKTPGSIPASIKRIHATNTPGLEHVSRLGDLLISGSLPTDDGFVTLARLGVKTIISVDGATPDVAAARQYGLRYIHLPMSYSGVPRNNLLTMLRAVRELPKPIYIHCHHGRHRGPAAAVSVWRCLDPSVTPDEAVATLDHLGTSRRYRGLFRDVETLQPPTGDELVHASSAFPEVTEVPPLARQMAEIDGLWDRVSATPSDATMASLQLDLTFDLVEHFTEASRQADITDDVRQGLLSTADEFRQLAELMRSGIGSANRGSAQTTARLLRIKQQCADCHARHRD